VKKRPTSDAILFLQIFDCLLSMRADSNCRLGCPDPETKQMKFSPYLGVSFKPVEATVTSPPSTIPTQIPICKISYLPIEGAFVLFLKYLESEKGEWSWCECFCLERSCRRLGGFETYPRQATRDVGKQGDRADEIGKSRTQHSCQSVVHDGECSGELRKGY
jgi:hypothetical protein